MNERLTTMALGIDTLLDGITLSAANNTENNDLEDITISITIPKYFKGSAKEVFNKVFKTVKPPKGLNEDLIFDLFINRLVARGFQAELKKLSTNDNIMTEFLKDASTGMAN